MIFTRSSRVQTRASTKRNFERSGVNKKLQIPSSCVSDKERISTKKTPRKCINTRRKSPTLHNQNVTNNSSLEKSKKIGEDSMVNHKRTIEVKKTVQVKEEDILQTTFDSSENFKVYCTKDDYQDSLAVRSRGNPLLRSIVINFDKQVSLSKFKTREHSNVSGSRNNIREDILDAFETLVNNGSNFEYIDNDQELSTMGITQKIITVKLSNMYISMKNEMKKQQKLQNKRLRPRGEKIDYNLLNGTKSFSKTTSLRNKEPEVSLISSSSSIEFRREDCVESRSSRAAGRIRHCIMSNDNVSNTFETSTAKPSRCFKDRQILNEHSHLERRRRNCSNNIINWKYCYYDDKSARKSIKRSMPRVNEKLPSSAKRFKASKTSTDIIDISDDTDSDDIRPQESPSMNEIKHLSENCRRVSQIQTLDRNSQNKTSTKLTKEKKEVGCLSKTMKDDIHSSCHQPIANTGPDHLVKRENSGGEFSGLEKILKNFIKKAVIDESKLKISANPVIAELSEVNNDQFYRLVVTLQGTDFLVKSAVMKNVRSSSEKIAQVYNCTICHVDDVEKELTSNDSKRRDSLYSKPKHDSISSDKKSAVDSKTRNAYESALVNAECHRRSRTNSSTMKHKLPSQPQSKSKSSHTPRVPPIIFPAHVNNGDYYIENLSSDASDDMEEQKIDNRVVVKSTCYESFPLINSDSEDSDRTSIDDDLNRRIISDIVQTKKWSPDYHRLCETLKRMGRRKTDPDIHPATRRLRQKIMKKNHARNRNFSRLWNGKELNRNERAEEERIRDLSSEHFDSLTFLTPERTMNAPKLATSSIKPQRVRLDNRGRFLDPCKQVKLVEETPATALTASERLKLRKEEYAKTYKTENHKASLEQSSSSTASPSPVRNFKDKRETESCNDSDFELDRSRQPQKAVVCPASSSLAEIQSSNTQLSSNSGIIHVKIIPRPQSAATTGPKTPSNPTPHDKDGYRKILPKPSMTPKISHTTTLSIASNLNRLQNTSTKRQIIDNKGHQSTVARVEQPEQKMRLLKSMLGQKSLMAPGGKKGREEGTCEMTNVHRKFTDGSLRVPPASSYMTSPATATLRLPTYLRPITVQLTHVKERSLPVSNDDTSKDQGN